MKKSSLLLVPSGGLANRMRAIASAYHLCLRNDSILQVVWFQGWGMHAAFRDIFDPIVAENLKVREATKWDFVVNDRPRRHNLWLPAIPQYLYYLGGNKNELCIASMRDNGFDFDKWLKGHRRYMSCYDEFGSFPNTAYSTLFHPNNQVKALMKPYEEQFSNYTVGMHIRRTDNIDSIRKSPTYLFVEAGERELAAHPNLTIFLATDSEEVKKEMRQAFAGRIITANEEASRDSVEGIRAGLADMWLLSRTCKIYGSAGSSFSEMAARVGGIRLQICQESSCITHNCSDQ